jgi:hypothetical protein
MFVTSRLVMEGDRIFSWQRNAVGPNRSLDEAAKTLDGGKYGERDLGTSRQRSL